MEVQPSKTTIQPGHKEIWDEETSHFVKDIVRHSCFSAKGGKTKTANIALGACLNVQCLKIGRASSCMHECRSPLIYLQLKEFFLHGGSRW